MKSLGNTALVDLTAGTVEVAPTPDHLVQAFLGGRGLNMFSPRPPRKACTKWSGVGATSTVPAVRSTSAVLPKDFIVLTFYHVVTLTSSDHDTLTMPVVCP